MTHISVIYHKRWSGVESTLGAVSRAGDEDDDDDDDCLCVYCSTCCSSSTRRFCRSLCWEGERGWMITKQPVFGGIQFPRRLFEPRNRTVLSIHLAFLFLISTNFTHSCTFITLLATRHPLAASPAPCLLFPNLCNDDGVYWTRRLT